MINTEIPFISKKEKHEASLTSEHKKKTGNATLRNFGNNLGGY
jgi:hypothetical protein